MTLTLRPRPDSRWDLVALGEVMLRLDPGDERIHTARQFRAWEGGGEYNVARGLSRCFGAETTIVTAFADNPVGRLIEDLVRQGGVDRSHIRWVPYDGIGRTVRNGLNFTERGFGVRGAIGSSDRANTAASQMTAFDVDWEAIFGREGARWFHTGGVFAALSDTTPGVIDAAISAARRTGRSYRSTSTTANCCGVPLVGVRPPSGSLTRLVASVDVLVGNEEDFVAALGLDVAGVDASFDRLEADAYARDVDGHGRALPEPARDRRDAARRPNGQSKRLGGAALVGRCRVPGDHPARSGHPGPDRRRRLVRLRPDPWVSGRAPPGGRRSSTGRPTALWR